MRRLRTALVAGLVSVGLVVSLPVEAGAMTEGPAVKCKKIENKKKRKACFNKLG